MNDKFTPLDCNDVVLLGKDTFIVSRLKELLEEKLRSQLQRHIYEDNSLDYGISMLDFFSQIWIGKTNINLIEIQHDYLTDCQVLKIGGQGWQKGQLKIQICVSVSENQNQLCLGFSADEPNEYESLLDDICKIIQEER